MNENRYKIGYSNEVAKRHKTFKISNLDIFIVKTWKVCTGAKQIESKIHKAFSSQRIEGEWFKIDNIEAVMNTIEDFIK